MVNVIHAVVPRAAVEHLGMVAAWTEPGSPSARLPPRVLVPLAIQSFASLSLFSAACLLLFSAASPVCITCVTCVLPRYLRHLRPPAPSAPPASSCAICATHSNTRASRARTSTSAASASERSTAPLPYLPAHSTRTSTPSSSGALLLAAVSRLSRDPCTPHIADGVHEHEDGQL